jgi:tetratricopeptide (TPR) repeat protein/tRNA A-37 threonylcarbamoyl transferase component Bud32/TolB-like protein
VPTTAERLTAALAGRYAIQREIGAGGMATVYLAEDVKHRRKVAVKVLRPELAVTLGPERFTREIEIAAQLQHPHILPLLDSGEADGFLYFVMPFVDGESLRERLARKGELPIPEAIRILVEVTDALAHAHRRGVVHRDMKPDNIMLSERHALVTDFGVAKAVSEATGRQQMTTAGVALGTPAYMAPEQAAADPNVDHRADIYALGIVAYELIAGRPPFTGMSAQEILAAHVTQAPQPLIARRPACPPALSAVIMKCLEKRPSDRWQSAEELLAQLEPLATPSGGMTPTQTQPTQAVAMPGEWYGHPVRVGGVFVLVAIAVLGAVYFLTVKLGLPDWVMTGAIVLLLAGLPIMIWTGVTERKRAVARSTGMFTSTGEEGIKRFATWKQATMGGVYAFAGLACVAVVYTAMRLMGIGPVGTLMASGKLAERDKLIVSDFVNHAADTTLAQSVSEAFRIDIAQSQVVNVLGSSTVGQVLRRMNRDPRLALDGTVAREVAMREGAKAVVVGEISPIGKGLVLSAKVLTAVDGTELVSARETASDEGQILPAIDRLSKRIRERIGESLKTIRGNEPLAAVTTSSLEALRMYTEGARASDAGDADKAITLLQQAIALDTGFAMAYRKLSVAISNSLGSTAAAADAATKAYNHRDRLTEIERYQTEAYYYFTVDFDPEKQISAYRAILELKPDDPIAPNNLSIALTSRRRFAEAEAVARKWIVEQHGSGNIYVTLLVPELALGEYDSARASLDEFARRDSANLLIPRLREVYFVAREQLDSAQIALHDYSSRATDPSDKALALRMQASLGLYQGRESEFEDQARQFMDIAERRGLPGDYVAAAAFMARTRMMYLHDVPGGLRILEAALARHPLKSMDAADRPYGIVILDYATAGQADKAGALLKEYQSEVPVGLRRGSHDAYTAAGYVSMAQGKPAQALSEFREGYDQDQCTSCVQADIGWAFEQLKQPDSAIAAYKRAVDTPKTLGALSVAPWDDARAFQRLGDLYEAKGDKANALAYYGRFAKRWANADESMQPIVKDVKARMAKLAGEGK